MPLNFTSRNKSILKLFLMVAIFATAVYTFFIVVFPVNNELTVINNSSSTVKDGRVTITNRNYQIQSLLPGDVRRFKFATYAGTPVYTVDFMLSTGKRLRLTSGYICRGVRNYATITVNKKDELELNCSARSGLN